MHKEKLIFKLLKLGMYIDILIVIFIAFVFSFTLINTQKLNNNYYIFKVEIKDSVYITPEDISDSLSIENVKGYIKALGIKHDKIVLAQVILETGHLKSVACKQKNNLFGFTSKSGIMSFTHWKESVRYYSDWQYRHYQEKLNNSPDDYYKFLIKVNYAQDPEYISKLKKIVSNFK